MGERWIDREKRETTKGIMTSYWPIGSLKLVGPELKGEEMIEDVVEIHLDL